MPKSFTIKDFVSYNNPCFNCQRSVSIDLNYRNSFGIPVHSRSGTSTPNEVSFELKMGYSEFIYLEVNYLTQKIRTNNEDFLKKYLQGNEKYLTLRSYCHYCCCEISTHPLKFNFNKGIIELIALKSERLLINDSTTLYQIETDFNTNKSILFADRIDKTSPLAPTKIELSILPLYSFKSKQTLVDKLRKILLFS